MQEEVQIDATVKRILFGETMEGRICKLIQEEKGREKKARKSIRIIIPGHTADFMDGKNTYRKQNGYGTNKEINNFDLKTNKVLRVLLYIPFGGMAKKSRISSFILCLKKTTPIPAW